jgi:hypothetical protein
MNETLPALPYGFYNVGYKLELADKLLLVILGIQNNRFCSHKGMLNNNHIVKSRYRKVIFWVPLKSLSGGPKV